MLVWIYLQLYGPGWCSELKFDQILGFRCSFRQFLSISLHFDQCWNFCRVFISLARTCFTSHLSILLHEFLFNDFRWLLLADWSSSHRTFGHLQLCLSIRIMVIIRYTQVYWYQQWSGITPTICVPIQFMCPVNLLPDLVSRSS